MNIAIVVLAFIAMMTIQEIVFWGLKVVDYTTPSTQSKRVSPYALAAKTTIMAVGFAMTFGMLSWGSILPDDTETERHMLSAFLITMAVVLHTIGRYRDWLRRQYRAQSQ